MKRATHTRVCVCMHAPDRQWDNVTSKFEAYILLSAGGLMHMSRETQRQTAFNVLHEDVTQCQEHSRHLAHSCSWSSVSSYSIILHNMKVGYPWLPLLKCDKPVGVGGDMDGGRGAHPWGLTLFHAAENATQKRTNKPHRLGLSLFEADPSVCLCRQSCAHEWTGC